MDTHTYIIGDNGIFYYFILIMRPVRDKLTSVCSSIMRIIIIISILIWTAIDGQTETAEGWVTVAAIIVIRIMAKGQEYEKCKHNLI